MGDSANRPTDFLFANSNRGKISHTVNLEKPTVSLIRDAVSLFVISKADLQCYVCHKNGYHVVNIIKKIIEKISSAKQKFFPGETNTVPLLIIKKEKANENIKEYNSIESAIADLENDANVSKEKLEKLKTSFNNLKFKSSIKIKESEII